MKMTPSEAFVETMVSNNVTDMFGIMGSAFMDAMDIFAPAGIRLIPEVHEQGAGHMADGYSRVSGRHGVVIGQNGPGISNCVTAVAAAYWAHSPVVVITPETGTMGMGLGGFQEANQLPMFQEFTKYQGMTPLKSPKVVPLDVDENGVIPGKKVNSCEFVYLTPSHQSEIGNRAGSS